MPSAGLSFLLGLCLLFIFSVASSTHEVHHEHHNDLKHSAKKRLGKRQLPDFAQRNLNTIRKIYDLTVYPYNDPIQNQGGSAVPPGLFAQNTVGRVSPVGEFEGFEDSIEYFFALAPSPKDPNFRGAAIYEAQVVEFTSGCPEIAASLVYLRTAKVDANTYQVDTSQPMSTLSQVAFWQFDPYGQVERYHAWIPNLEAWVYAQTGFDFSSYLLEKAVPLFLCPQIQERCTGSNQQYLDVLTCTLELDLKPFGSFDEAYGDTVACRIIHLLLTKVHPDVHCPHVGPTGGGKCSPIEYSKDYFDDDQLFGVPVGSAFTCGGPLISPYQYGSMDHVIPPPYQLQGQPRPQEQPGAADAATNNPLNPLVEPVSGLLQGIAPQKLPSLDSLSGFLPGLGGGGGMKE
ncbi:Bifonsecin B biosynthesis cluster protein A [Pseudocercospora fuligena]|uniref:Bifonsecin B biosynthesis cluster protein A n=1 Tax=Pseudocercospora fuligena TaxID=685502 RepID=A0A8H6RY04_9PEZI|nr:Bifonsecin B biosynthesis cluster protein A [Pseudocercospora fuligena]